VIKPKVEVHKSLVETKLKDSEPNAQDLEVAIKNHEEVGKLLSKMKDKIFQTEDTQGWQNIV
jgi:hypothetical protein